MLGDDAVAIDLNAPAPVTLLMVGLQGSGKTTTTAKIAKRLKDRKKKKVLLASLDTRRPAAMEQLRVLGEQVGVDTLPIVASENPVQIARRAEREGRLGGYDVLILDTAGRTHIDEELMAETVEHQGRRQAARNPAGGRCADRPGRDQRRPLVRYAPRYHRHRHDPRRRRWPRRRGALDARGDRQADQADRRRRKDGCAGGFPSPRIADRILGMGDIVSLVEKAAEHVSVEDARRWPRSSRRVLRPRRPAQPAHPDEEDGRHGRPDGA